MCICFFFYDYSKKTPYKFVFSFNRDERINRQTKSLHQFQDDENIVGGRDLEFKGTWLGINKKTGIIAFLTNYDTDKWFDISDFKYGRGYLPLRFLNSKFITSDENITKELNQILAEKDKFNAFNLVVGNLFNGKFYYICNHYTGEQPVKLQESVYGLCNSDLFTIWPKTQLGIELFSFLIQSLKLKDKEEEEQKQQSSDDNHVQTQLLQIMQNNKCFSQDQEQESSIFVEQYPSKQYKQARGTVSTTLVTIKHNNECQITEHMYSKINYQNQYEQYIKNPIVTKINFVLKEENK